MYLSVALKDQEINFTHLTYLFVTTMADPELAAIRAARMQQLQQAGGPSGGEDEAKKQSEEQMRRDLLATVLDSAARERRTFLSAYYEHRI